MITYRMETQPPVEDSSSKIFTYIAVTFVAVALAVVSAVFILTRRSLNVTIIAKDDIRTVTVPIKISTNDKSNTLSTATTTVFRYSQTFYPTGIKTVESIATGQVILFNKTSAAQPLVKTTRLLSKEGVLFHLSDKVTVPANGQVGAAVYADKPGKSGEIASTHFTIPGLAEDKQKVIYADSSAAFVGGVHTSAVLSQKDIDEAKKNYRSKVLAAFEGISDKKVVNGTANIAMVYKDDMVADKKVGDEVTSFSISGSNTIVDVTYSKDEVLSAIQKELRSSIDATSEKILSATKEPTVTLASFNPAIGLAELSVTQEVAVTIDPNADKLAPANFFGKSRDEIERYLLGLDHVGRVDVALSPSWIDSAPKSPDKIKVVVKDM